MNEPLAYAGAGVNRGHASAFTCVCFVVLPWVFPFAGGPSPSVQPWLLSALCVGVVAAFQLSARVPAAVAFALGGLTAWTVVRAGSASDAAALAGACLLIYLATSIGAGASYRSEMVKAVALGWVLAATASTLFGLAQYFGLADRFAPWVSPANVGEAFANLRQRNQFASLTVIGIAALLCWPGATRRTWPAALTMVWLAVGNAATTSRTGLAELLLLGVMAAVWPGARRRRLVLWLAGVLAYVLAALSLPMLLEAVAGGGGNRLWERVAAVDACGSRIVLWSNVLQLIGQKPWLGWGWGELDYAHYLTLHGGLRFCDILDNAHNLPLHLAVELGVPFALLASVVLVWAGARGRPWRESDPARQLAWAVLAVLAMHSLLEYPLWYGPFQIACGVCLGLLLSRAGGEQMDRGTASARSPVARGMAICLIAAVIYAGWDYRRVSQIYLPDTDRAEAYRDDALSHIRRSWLFRHQAEFAEFTITPLTLANARWTYDTGSALLHYSPEPRVVEKVIESATMLGRTDEAMLHMARYRAAFPDSYAKWLKIWKNEAALFHDDAPLRSPVS